MNLTYFILLLVVYPFIFIMYFLIKNFTTPQKKMCFGVTLTKEQQASPEVVQITDVYKRQMRLIFWIMIIAPIPGLLVPWFSICLTLYMLWILASCFVFFIPTALANIKLKELKSENGWKTTAPPVYTEIKSANNVRKVKWYHFLPQNLISICLLLWGLTLYQGEIKTVMSIFLGAMALVIPLFWLAALWMDKQKTQIISSDSDVNVNYARAKKNLWKNFWCSCCWITVLYMATFPFMLGKTGELNLFFWIANIAYTTLTLLLLFWIVKKKNAVDAAYRDQITEYIPDDDDNWLWGMVYYNPKDKHTMVETRVGIGTTVNMATPAGKGTIVFSAVALLSIPVICIWVILLEFTPIHLTLENRELIATHLKQEYVIPLDSVENHELLTELPRLSKSVGSAMDNLLSGSFFANGTERCSVFLNPENTLFIRLEADGITYYLGGYDDPETQFIYDNLH